MLSNKTNKEMNTVVIIGAGQLGSRHLQGVKLASHSLNIWVCDTSFDSLRVAEERYHQISSPTMHTVHFVNDWGQIPLNIDVVIVATGSIPRAGIVDALITTHNVRYMVLEKFLFPRMAEYDAIQAMIDQYHVPTFVNCTRRMWQLYDLVAMHIDRTKPIKMQHIGGDWGLCCNSIHYIDIFMHLSGAKSYTLDINGLIPEVIPSKRDGYIELRGKEIIITPEGNQLILEANPEHVGVSSDVIINGDRQIRIDETKGVVEIGDLQISAPIQYQSALSGIFVDNLLSSGTCALTPYTESAQYHKIFLSQIGPFVNTLLGTNSDTCPIT